MPRSYYSLTSFGDDAAMGSINYKRFDYVVSLGCALLLCYFAVHAFYGPRNFAHRDFLAAQAQKFSLDLDAIATKRKALEDRVVLMRPDSIDPDLADELARKTLNFANPSEIVAYYGP